MLEQGIVYMVEDCRGSFEMYPVKDMLTGIVLCHVMCGPISRDHDLIQWRCINNNRIIGCINGGPQFDFVIFCMPICALNEYTKDYLNDVVYFKGTARVFLDLPGQDGRWSTRLPSSADPAKATIESMVLDAIAVHPMTEKMDWASPIEVVHTPEPDDDDDGHDEPYEPDEDEEEEPFQCRS